MAWLRFRPIEIGSLFFKDDMVNSPKNCQGRVIFALVFLGVVCPASAQEPESRFELFGQFGGAFFTEKSAPGEVFVLDPVFVVVTIPTRKTTSLTKTGRLFVGVRYYFTAQDAVEVSYSYSPNDIRQEEVSVSPLQTFPPFVDELDGYVHLVSFNYVRYLVRNGSWRPFVTGGLGFARFEGFPFPTKFTANFGGGVDFVVHENLSLRFEYRDFLMGQPMRFRNSPQGLAQNHGPSAGLVFKF